MKHFLVKDWMTSDVLTARPKDLMIDAHKQMRERKIRRLPIVDDRGRLVGIVTRSDVRQAQPSDATTLTVWELNYLLAKLQLKDIMSREVVSVRPEDTIKTAAARLHDRQIGALPVVDEKNRVVGIITESDIFRVLIAWLSEEEATGS